MATLRGAIEDGASRPKRSKQYLYLYDLEHLSVSARLGLEHAAFSDGPTTRSEAPGGSHFVDGGIIGEPPTSTQDVWEGSPSVGAFGGQWICPPALAAQTNSLKYEAYLGSDWLPRDGRFSEGDEAGAF
ncbi:Dehydrogenase [Penicillium brevicompactum]